jgi:hypothetical protein
MSPFGLIPHGSVPNPPRGTGYIDGCKSTMAQQKTMAIAAAVRVVSDNVALWIDPIRARTPRRRARKVDVFKFAFA